MTMRRRLIALGPVARRTGDLSKGIKVGVVLSERMSRRKALIKCAATTFIGTVAIIATGESQAADKVCADPKSIDAGARSIRESLKYTEAFPDTSMRCAACAFYQAGAPECGMCQIFSGLVNASGHCDSWSPKN
jgi:hypothetical protein